MPTFTITTSVLPGGEVRVTAPELKEGQRVEVTVRVPDAAEGKAPPSGIYDLIRSFGPSTKTAEEWAQFEREFQEEKDSWDR